MTEVSTKKEEVKKEEQVTIPFSTKDLNLAAFIWTQDKVKLTRVEARAADNKKKTTVFFMFELAMDQQEFYQLHMNYVNGNAMIEPLTFVSKQEQLRDLLYNAISLPRTNKKEE